MDGDSEDNIQSRVSQIVHTPIIQKQQTHKNNQTNIAKFGFNKIFYQKNNQLLVMELSKLQKPCSLEYYHFNKETHQKDIKRFKLLYIHQEFEAVKKKKRGYSIDSDLGAYYLNNWLSHDQYLCDKPHPDEKTACIMYEILGKKWNKAIQIINSIQKSPQMSTLQYILIGFRSISVVLNEEDRFLTEHFLERPNYEIKLKLSSQSIGGYANFVNILQQQSKNKFSLIRSMPRKVEILKINLEYLVKFTQSYRPKTDDSYIQLAFKFLGNSIDQNQLIPEEDKDKDFFNILLSLDLKLSDRINFSMKLLNEKKRKDFCAQMQQKLCFFPKLDNIIFYTSHPISKNKEQKIDHICKSYLDKYSDLETIACLAQQFPFLQKYERMFKQALQLSFEYEQLQKLQNHKFHNDKNKMKSFEIINKRTCSFFDYININEEKIEDWKFRVDNTNVCQICSKKINKVENFLQCGKCKHGGHVNHLLKWFDEYQNCAHIGCPCLCN